MGYLLSVPALTGLDILKLQALTPLSVTTVLSRSAANHKNTVYTLVPNNKHNNNISI